MAKYANGISEQKREGKISFIRDTANGQRSSGPADRSWRRRVG
jgi:hypothetical protein